MKNITDQRFNTVNTLANATMLSLSMFRAVVGDDLGDQMVTEQGRAGLARMIANRFNLNSSKKVQG